MRVDQVVIDPDKTIRSVLRALANRLTFLDNMQCVIIDVLDSGPANTEFTVEHNLGKVPLVYIGNSDAGFVYDSNRATWTITQMTLKCSASNAVLKLVIF